MSSILLLHGALGSTQQLSGLRSTLQSNRADLFELNFSGHGGNSFEKDFGIEQFASEVEQFVLTEKLSDVTIFGYSMGGYVAAWLSVQNPKLISRIITLGTKFDWSPESAGREIRKMNPEKIEQRIPAFARVLEHRHQPNNWKLLMKKTADMMKQLGENPLLTEQNLKRVQAKVLIILGDRDDMADLEFSKNASNWIPNSKFVLLQDAPHPIEKVDLNKLSNLILGELISSGKY